MITKVVHGWRVGGLVAYLMGPGRAQEHVRPRIVASWDGRDSGWQPQQNGASEFDLELGPLIRALRAPAVAAGLPESDGEGKRGYVWHCSARVAAGDRVLSDAQWASIARDLLDGAGVAVRGDAGGPRWVAIRHADDHIHIAVVLVRQDTCRRFWPSRDYPRLREAAQRIERRLGLTLTASADGTAARAPGRGELEKARRQGREPARVELARAVRIAAVASGGAEEFVSALQEAGYLVELRRAPSGDPLGYKVARRGDVTASGSPVFYSGSKLAPDLSLPRLLRAWEESSKGSEAAAPTEAARRRVEGARAAVGAARRGRGGEDVDGIAHATRDVLTAMTGWSGDLDAAAEVFDRAARPPRGATAVSGPSAAGLRRVARQLVRQRRMLGVSDEPGAAAVALAVALTALLREIAAWQRERDREHQSAAARAAADTIGRWAASAAPPTSGSLLDHGSAVPRPQLDRPARRRSDQPRG
ncbi:relaxase/mobilization nuclease domain-containing protein [Pseudonocardia sichuanensis]